MLCGLQEAGGTKGTQESASASLNEDTKLIGDHLFTLCCHAGYLQLDFVGCQTTTFNHRDLHQDQEEAEFLLQWEILRAGCCRGCEP